MDRIPIELVDCILSELHPPYWSDVSDLPLNGKADLDACTLVARSWTEPAQRHLFRDITYSFQASRNPRVAAIGLPGLISSPRVRTLSMLLEFLQRSPPHFARYIHRLTLDLWPESHIPGMYITWVTRSVIWLTSTDAVDYGTLVSLLHSLPCLDSLRLCNMNLTEEAPTRSFQNRLRLSHFSISNESFTQRVQRMQCSVTFQNFSRLLGLIEQAKEFSAAWIKPDEEPSGADIAIDTEDLIFSGRDTFFPRYAASKHANLNGVRRVNWGSYLGPSAYFQGVVSNIGAQLVELRALLHLSLHELASDIMSGSITPFVDLSPCHQLESFTLGLRVEPLMSSNELYAVCSSVQSLPQKPSKLRELSVVLDFVVFGEQFDLLRWIRWISKNAEPIHLLEESLTILMDRCSPPLERLIVRSKWRRSTKEAVGGEELDMVPFLREMFPKLKEAGRIRTRPFYSDIWQTFQARD